MFKRYSFYEVFGFIGVCRVNFFFLKCKYLEVFMFFFCEIVFILYMCLINVFIKCLMIRI